MKLGGNGYKFADTHTTKGCYAYDAGKYKGRAYYGIRGSIQAMKTSLKKPQYRPRGYGCLGIGINFIHIHK